MNIKIKILGLMVFFMHQIGISQTFNVEQFKDIKWLNVSGGFNASSILYSGTATRDPFAVYLNGNINLTVAGLYSLPFSFSYSSQKFGTTTPVLINRLSVHPTYKGVTAHIGDVNMTFSPYTLSGHQFTGLGVDLTPKGHFKISAMYGRLLRKIEYNPLETTIVPMYKRMGYGFKSSYEFEKININLIFFKAKDELNSLQTALPEQLGVTPKDNAVFSFGTQFKLFKKLQFTTEFASSTVTEDTRDNQKISTKGIGNLFLINNATTTNYKAYKAQMTYPVAKGTLGLGYEHIDPNYKTLGGYFFNNDLENMTLNASQSILKDKVNLAFNVGLQRDNLNDAKASESKRLVSAINVDLKANDKLNFGFNYSNFQSFTNSRNQFDYINQTNNLQNLDTLNYRQINQNMGLNINYLLRSDDKYKKNISSNFSIQNSDNLQGGRSTDNGSTKFYNATLAYVYGINAKALTITTALNTAYNQTDINNLIIGPTIAANKQFFDKKLNTSCTLSYNNSYTEGVVNSKIANVRLNAGYLYKQKHNFNLSAIIQNSQSFQTTNHDITATISYAYSFDKIKIQSNKSSKPKDSLGTIAQNFKFNYKGFDLEGSRKTITDSLQNLVTQLHPLTTAHQALLQQELDKTRATQTDKDFKEKTLNYLDRFDAIKTQLIDLNTSCSFIIKKLAAELKSKDISAEKAYFRAFDKLTEHPLHNTINEADTNTTQYHAYQKLKERSDIQKQKLLVYRWMQQEFEKMSLSDNAFLNHSSILALYNQEATQWFQKYNFKKTTTPQDQELQLVIIAFFEDLAIKNTVNTQVELQNSIKN